MQERFDDTQENNDSQTEFCHWPMRSLTQKLEEEIKKHPRTIQLNIIKDVSNKINPLIQKLTELKQELEKIRSECKEALDTAEKINEWVYSGEPKKIHRIGIPKNMTREESEKLAEQVAQFFACSPKDNAPQYPAGINIAQIIAQKTIDNSCLESKNNDQQIDFIAKEMKLVIDLLKLDTLNPVELKSLQQIIDCSETQITPLELNLILEKIKPEFNYEYRSPSAEQINHNSRIFKEFYQLLILGIRKAFPKRGRKKGDEIDVFTYLREEKEKIDNIDVVLAIESELTYSYPYFDNNGENVTLSHVPKIVAKYGVIEITVAQITEAPLYVLKKLTRKGVLNDLTDIQESLNKLKRKIQKQQMIMWLSKFFLAPLLLATPASEARIQPNQQQQGITNQAQEYLIIALETNNSEHPLYQTNTSTRPCL